MPQSSLSLMPEVEPSDMKVGEVQVWHVALDGLGEYIPTMTNLLSSDEREKAARFHFDRDSRAYILRRGVLRSLLGRYLELKPQQVCFSYGRWGKPTLDPDHHPRIDLTFNLASSRNIVLLAFTRRVDIGVDVEYLRALPDAEQIAARYFSKTEQQALARVPQEQMLKAFFDCWTRKEAYIKALGVGLSCPLDSFSVSLTPGEPARLLQSEQKPGDSEQWSLVSWRPHPDYTAALALNGAPIRVNQQFLPLNPETR